MFDIVIKWLLSAFIIVVATYIVPGVHVHSFFVALVVALLLGVLNAFVKPILLLLTLPLTFLTLGLFIFVLNALLIIIVSKIVSGFSVDNFFVAVLFSIVVTILNSFLNHRIKST